VSAEMGLLPPPAPAETGFSSGFHQNAEFTVESISG